MTDLKHTFKKKLSNQIGSQVPEFVIAEHPKCVEFLESYFLFMESADLVFQTLMVKNLWSSTPNMKTKCLI